MPRAQSLSRIFLFQYHKQSLNLFVVTPKKEEFSECDLLGDNQQCITLAPDQQFSNELPYIQMDVWMDGWIDGIYIYIYIYIYVCMYVCMCIYMYVCIYISNLIEMKYLYY